MNIYLFSGLGSNQLILKSGNKGSGTDGKRIILSSSAGEFLTAYRTYKVNGSDVVLLNGTIHIHHSGILLQLLIQTLGNFLRAYRYVSLLCGNTEVLSKSNLRTYGNSSGEDKVLSLSNLLNADFRTGNDV